MDKKQVHRCKGYKIPSSPNFPEEYDCEYSPPFPCDECIFVHRQNGSNGGKYPWAKKYQENN